jgi:hypothetical protein
MHAVPVCRIDVTELAERLQDDSLFGEFNWRKEKYAHKDMRDIWVRYNHISNLGDKFNDSHESVWYPIIKKMPEVLPVVFELMARVNGERLGGVLITKLPSGGRIAKHVDNGWHAEYYEKFFVPIQNAKGARFCWDGQTLEPNAGEVWQFDNSVPHWVDNDSEVDRIAMIVCIKTLGSSLNEIE